MNDDDRKRIEAEWPALKDTAGDGHFYRGHAVVLVGELDEDRDYDAPLDFRYADNGHPTPGNRAVPGGEERPCPRCGQVAELRGPDPCLGMLAGVKNACCGHGIERAYVSFEDGRHITGDEALRYFRSMGKNV